MEKKEAAMAKQEPLTPIRKEYINRFLLLITFLLMIAIPAASMLLYHYLDQPLGEDYIKALARLTDMRSELLKGILISVSLQLCLTSFGIGLLTIFWTHKIAGPMYRLRLWLNQVSHGKITRFSSLRKNDQLKELPDLINSGLQALLLNSDKLRQEISENRVKVEKIMAKFDLNHDIDLYALSNLKKGLLSLNERIKQISGCHKI